MLFMTVENKKDVYSDLLIVQDWRDRTLVFLQEKENLTRMIIAKLKEMVLRDMHATGRFTPFWVSWHKNLDKQFFS